MESEYSLSDAGSLNSDVLDSTIAIRSKNALPLSTSASTTSSLLPLELQINGVNYEVVERMKNKRGKTSWV
jgi:hypothetical protein